MKITIYELLGLIKDDKAPLRIKYESYIWELRKQYNDYYNEECYLIGNLIERYINLQDLLAQVVEIIEIIEEKPKHIEELKLNQSDVWNGKTDTDLILEKINELRKAVNYLLDKEK